MQKIILRESGLVVYLHETLEQRWFEKTWRSIEQTTKRQQMDHDAMR